MVLNCSFSLSIAHHFEMFCYDMPRTWTRCPLSKDNGSALWLRKQRGWLIDTWNRLCFSIALALFPCALGQRLKGSPGSFELSISVATWCKHPESRIQTLSTCWGSTPLQQNTQLPSTRKIHLKTSTLETTTETILLRCAGLFTVTRGSLHPSSILCILVVLASFSKHIGRSERRREDAKHCGETLYCLQSSISPLFVREKE